MKTLFNANIQVKGVQEEMELVREAEKILYEAKRKAVDSISAYLEENPDTALTCGAIGRLLGVSAPVAAGYMRDFGRNVKSVMLLDVVRHFAEIDDSGNLIPDGCVRTEKGTYTAFQHRKPGEVGPFYECR